MERDLVCGMEVDPTQALHTEYHGQTYAFCSLRCKRAFEDAPKTYAVQRSQADRSVKALTAVGQTLAMTEITDTNAV